MSISKKLFIILLFIILMSSFAYCQEDNKKAVEIVASYLKKQLSESREVQNQGIEYIHPNLAIPGGEGVQFSVVDTKYTIAKVQRKRMNIDIIEPKDEEIITVTVLFDRYCDIINDEFIPAAKEYTRDYFLSRSTGKWLIIDLSVPEPVSLGYAINRISEIKVKSKKWGELYKKLVDLQEKIMEEETAK